MKNIFSKFFKIAIKVSKMVGAAEKAMTSPLCNEQHFWTHKIFIIEGECNLECPRNYSATGFELSKFPKFFITADGPNDEFPFRQFNPLTF